MKNIFIAFLFLTLTTACVETVVVGSFTTIAVTTREKTIKATISDIEIAAQIDKELLVNSAKGFSNSIGVTVNEGRVLLTGVVRDAEHGKIAITSSWKVKGVKEVIDEIEISTKGVGIKDFTNIFSDSYITSAIKTKLFFHQQIFPSNYKVTTYNNVVYLLGVYKSEDDLRELISVVSKTYGVKKVVNHAISVDDGRRK